MNNKTLRGVCLAVTAALVAVFTMFISFPTGIGYVNLGDAVILFSAFLLGPMAGIPAALGSALSDLLLGYAVYAGATLLIKGLMGFLCGMLLRRGGETWGRRILAFAAAECVMAAGYFVFEIFCYGFAAALGSVPLNLLQGAAAIVCASALAPSKPAIMRALKNKGIF